jgi:choline-sulfatase
LAAIGASADFASVSSRREAFGIAALLLGCLGRPTLAHAQSEPATRRPGRARSIRRAVRVTLALTGVVVGVAAGLACRGLRGGMPRFPNAPVVLISIDTLRSDHLPAYGYRTVETPHLDRFRGDAILFRRAFSSCPMTLPSHVTMLTGLQPPEHRVRNNVGFVFRAAEHPTIATLLKQRGYATAAAVSSYVLRRETGLAQAFDEYEDSIDPRPGAPFGDYQRSGATTAAWARQWIAARKDRPFFLLLHLYEPHVPYDPPEPFRSRYPLPYDGEIATADDVVGQFLEFLKTAGLYERAIVIVTSDHGEGLSDHGEDQHSILLYREALQVPLLLKLPGSRRGGETVAAPAQLADLLPTVTSLLGIPRPEGLGGASSLLDLPPSRRLYAETLYPRIQLGWSELRSLLDERHHYIEGPRPELYDLEADPHETRDLAATEKAVIDTLHAELQKQPIGSSTPTDVDPAAAERLSALGYVGAPADRGAGPLPNPRDYIHVLGDFRAALRLADERRYAEAADALRALVTDSPGLVEVWTKLGELYRQLGLLDESVAAYAEALRHCPAPSADLVLMLGHAELARGRLDQAEAAASRALPGSPARAHDLLARVALARGRIDVAAEEARRARETSSQPSAIVLQAEVAIRRGAYAEALTLLDEAQGLAAERNMGPVHRLEFMRADALARSGRPVEAEAAYGREVAAFPDDLQAYANLAVLRFLSGNRAAVASTLEDMVRANPGRAANRVAAKTLETLGDRAAAAAWSRRAEKQAVKSGSARRR